MSESQLEKTYHPEDIEKKWYKIWEESNYFAHSNNGDPYCIMLPPPNVTGTLHMGHGFQITLMDALIRHARMQGKNTLWQPGTDHAGIATQMVVEQQLIKKGTDRHQVGRENFVKKVWDWKNTSGGIISQQLRRMGASVDWSRERFTMDEGIAKAVQDAFIRLYDDALIYRGKFLVNWDPVLHTALADLEVVSKEEDGFLWHINYPLADNSGHICVATTRPETLLGDTGVAVNPDDERYKHLIGKDILLPLTNRKIKIIADSDVLQEFGTGCVKITPAHDFTDYAIGKRHQLDMINIFTIDAKLNENAPEKYQGMDRFEARKIIVDDLQKAGFMEKIEPYKVTIPRGERSNSVIEPYLTDQWFVKTKPLAEPAMNAVKNGELEFVPDKWTKVYMRWLEEIQDWCISRQLWWGHRIPAWYDQNGKVYVAETEQAVRKKYSLSDDLTLTQDEDVLDTWFSSALWPFATLDWPQETVELAEFYPTSVLVTGFDIIFFWVARMVMMGLKFLDKVPFKKVYIHGLIRDSEGQKMSKSKGNTLNPLDLIDGIDLESLVKQRTENLMLPKLAEKVEKNTRKEFPNGIAAHGTDALRFTFCALATPGRDINFDMGRIEGYKNFCNKIWNAARYVMMNTADHEYSKNPELKDLSIYDQWILAEFQNSTKKVLEAFSEFRFDNIAQHCYEFIWNEYCDWYLEFSKIVLMSEQSTENQKYATRHTLLYVLESTLRLIHPVMPYISEEIWQKIAPMLGIRAKTIMLQHYPEYHQTTADDNVVKEITWLKQVIFAIRNIRGEMNISPAKKIPLILNNGNEFDKSNTKNHQSTIMTLAKVNDITWLSGNAPASATALVNDLEILIPIAQIIDKKAELKRLDKELMKLNKDLHSITQKLNNSNFVEKAPKEVVEQEKSRQIDIEKSIFTLESQIKQIHLIETS